MFYVWDKLGTDYWYDQSDITLAYNERPILVFETEEAAREQARVYGYMRTYETFNAIDYANFVIRPYPTVEWEIRELSKFETLEYKKPVWFDERWYKNKRLDIKTYDHVSRKDDSQIAYTESAAKGEQDRQTATTPGRFLTKFFSDVLNPREIELWAGKHRETFVSPPTLSWARTPDEIEAVYSMNAAFGSCMQRKASSWGKKIGHPTRIYGAGDLAVAYLTQGERLIARALVWPDKKRVGRVYGNAELLRAGLRAEGIETKSNSSIYDSMEGARVLRIPTGKHERNGVKLDRVVGPYLDGRGNHAETLDENYLVIRNNDSRTEFYGSNQEGQWYASCKCKECNNYDNYQYSIADIEAENEIVIKSVCSYCLNKLGYDIRACPITGVRYEANKFKQEIVYQTVTRGRYEYAAVDVALKMNKAFKSDVSGLYFTTALKAKTGDGKAMTTREALDSYAVSNFDGIFYPKEKIVEFGAIKYSMDQVALFNQNNLFGSLELA